MNYITNSYDPEDPHVDVEAAAELVQSYDDVKDANPEELAGVFGASDEAEFYDKMDSELHDRIVENVYDLAARSDKTDFRPVAADGGNAGLDPSGNIIYDKVKGFVDKYPRGSKIAAASGLLAAGIGGLALHEQEDIDQGSGDNVEMDGDSVSFDEVDRLLSASNITEDDLTASYLGENISQENTDEVYSVFDDELLNGTELTQKLTDEDGNLKQEYINDDYVGNGSITFIDDEKDVSNILDRDKILEDMSIQGEDIADLKGDITRVEGWYEGEYEEEIVEDIAEEELNATAENVTVVGGEGNYTVTGTFHTDQGETYEQINIDGDIVEESKEDFTTVLQGLDTVRTLDQSDGEIDFTDSYIEELENGNFENIQDAREIGQTYESSNSSSSNVTEATVLGGYLQDETTERELGRLTSMSEQNPTKLVNSIEDPLSDDWSGDGADNLALMDLGLDPVNDYEILEDYNITREKTSEQATNNTYVIQETGDEGFSSNVTTGQLNTFSPAMLEINDEYDDLSQEQNSELFDEDRTTGELMTGLLDFSFNYMDNPDHTDTVTDISRMAVIEDGNVAYGDATLSEKVSYFNTFDQAWENPDDAFNFGRLMVNEDNLEDANDAGLQLLDPTYQQAAEDGFFSYENDERLTTDRLEELKDETDGFGDELREPSLEPDELHRLDDSGGSSSSSAGGDDGGGGDDGPSDGGGGPGTGGPGVGLLPLIGGRKIRGSSDSEENMIESIKPW